MVWMQMTCKHRHVSPGFHLVIVIVFCMSMRVNLYTNGKRIHVSVIISCTMFVKIYLVCFKLQIQLMYKLLFWSQDAEMHMYISLHASSPFTDISKPSVWSPGFPTNR